MTHQGKVSLTYFSNWMEEQETPELLLDEEDPCLFPHSVSPLRFRVDVGFER